MPRCFKNAKIFATNQNVHLEGPVVKYFKNIKQNIMWQVDPGGLFDTLDFHSAQLVVH